MKLPELWDGKEVISLIAAPAHRGRLRGKAAEKAVFLFYEVDGELHCDFGVSGAGCYAPWEWAAKLQATGKNERMRPIVGGHSDDEIIHFWWGRVEHRLIRDALIKSYNREPDRWDGLLNAKVIVPGESDEGLFNPQLCLGTIREIVNPLPESAYRLLFDQ